MKTTDRKYSYNIQRALANYIEGDKYPERKIGKGREETHPHNRNAKG